MMMNPMMMVNPLTGAESAWVRTLINASLRVLGAGTCGTLVGISTDTSAGVDPMMMMNPIKNDDESNGSFKDVDLCLLACFGCWDLWDFG